MASSSSSSSSSSAKIGIDDGSLTGTGFDSAKTSLPWSALSELVRERFTEPDTARGPTNAHSRVRLFESRPGTEPVVVLFRDNHYWCPYCEKVQLFLEAKQIPYRLRMVTMFCYGNKEPWYKQLVPSGMLPALAMVKPHQQGRNGDQQEQNGHQQGRTTNTLSDPRSIITESDDIMVALENRFGPLEPGKGMLDDVVVSHRQRERQLFRAWCRWLCYRSRSEQEENKSRERFTRVAEAVERHIQGPFMLGEAFTTADIIYVPYLERMNASLFYYKGYDLRERHPKLHAWFSALEKLDCYRGIMADFHTHAHDLPPQMGGCFSSESAEASQAESLVDDGPYVEGLLGKQVNPASYPEPKDSLLEAAHRVMKHASTLQEINPFGPDAVREGLQAALNTLLSGGAHVVEVPTAMSASDRSRVSSALRYIKDRVSVPRDMPIWSAMRFRQACEDAAAVYGSGTGKPIGLRDRYDQTPEPFKKAATARRDSL